ncbi:MAG: 1-acyl-sn-glycerol-3-phosphate acyltransferase [Aggregatilineales bacterium]
MLKFLTRILVEIIRFPVMLIWHASGWRLEPSFPDVDKLVILAVPHTTNMDFFHFLAMSIHERRRPYVTFKHTWFWFPMGILLRLLGGIPINRDKAMNVVDKLTDILNSKERLFLVFTPEGTRSKRKYWKTGFYYTALNAGLPILCGYINYDKKRAGGGLLLYPTGDIVADFEKIREFYLEHGQNGKFPERINDLQIKPHHYKHLVKGTKTDRTQPIPLDSTQ